MFKTIIRWFKHYLGSKLRRIVTLTGTHGKSTELKRYERSHYNQD